MKVAVTKELENMEINNPKNNPVHWINQNSTTTKKPLPSCTTSETIEKAIIHPIKFEKVIRICVMMWDVKNCHVVIPAITVLFHIPVDLSLMNTIAADNAVKKNKPLE